jgi:hypothetical protein
MTHTHRTTTGTAHATDAIFTTGTCRLTSLLCAAAILGCDALPTEPTGPTEPAAAAQLDIAGDLATLLLDPSVNAAATGHSVRVLAVIPPCEKKPCPEPPAPLPGTSTKTYHDYSFSAVQHMDGVDQGEFELMITTVTTEDTKEGAIVTTTTENVHGTVTCVAVKGNTATVGGVVDQGTKTYPEGSSLTWHVADLGESSSDPDVATPMVPGPSIKEACNVTLPPTQKVERGDIQVHDGQ